MKHCAHFLPGARSWLVKALKFDASVSASDLCWPADCTGTLLVYAAGWYHWISGSTSLFSCYFVLPQVFEDSSGLSEYYSDWQLEPTPAGVFFTPPEPTAASSHQRPTDLLSSASLSLGSKPGDNCCGIKVHLRRSLHLKWRHLNLAWACWKTGFRTFY